MRMNKSRKALSLLIGVIVVLLASCGAQPTPEPTIDFNVLSTNAAMTIEAEFTETALAAPTNTLEPTYTPLPTETVPSVESAGVIPTAGSGITLPTSAAGSGLSSRR